MCSACSACRSISCRTFERKNIFSQQIKLLTSFVLILMPDFILFCPPGDKFPVETGFVQETLLWKNSDALWRVLRLGPCSARLTVASSRCAVSPCDPGGDIRRWWHPVSPIMLWRPGPMIQTTCCWSLAFRHSSTRVTRLVGNELKMGAPT